MAMSLDKRTHWYVFRTKFGQRMRFCTSATTGIFVTDNTNASRHQVDCTKCITRMNKVAA